jgi:hypothetical protein
MGLFGFLKYLKITSENHNFDVLCIIYQGYSLEKLPCSLTSSYSGNLLKLYKFSLGYVF